MKTKILSCFAILLCLFSLAASAVESPLPMLQAASDQMLAKLKANKELKHDTAFIHKIVHEILVPHFDLQTMSRMVVGRDAWKNATAQQHQQFIAEFTTLLIRTYSTALSSYDDQTIQFYPIRGSLEGQTQTQVDSKILRREGPAIPVSYRLKLKNNTWKVYDFSVDGVSLIESFRSQFANELAQGGMTQLLQKLAAHNQQTK